MKNSGLMGQGFKEITSLAKCGQLSLVWRWIKDFTVATAVDLIKLLGNGGC
jgi:hypothetical protein